MNKTAEEVANKIATEIKDGAFKLQAIFDRNIQDIEALREDGYTYIRIYHALLEELADDGDLKERHFRDLLYRARKKVTARPTLPAKRVEAKAPKNEITEKLNKENIPLQTEKSNWLEVGVKKPILIEKLETAGLTPSDVEKWGLPNEMQISKRLTEYMMKKK